MHDDIYSETHSISNEKTCFSCVTVTNNKQLHDIMTISVYIRQRIQNIKVCLYSYNATSSNTCSRLGSGHASYYVRCHVLDTHMLIGFDYFTRP